MPDTFRESERHAIADHGIARVIPCRKLTYTDVFRWLILGLKDMFRAPGPTVFYGLVFAVIGWAITYIVVVTGGWFFSVFPAMVLFVLIGPVLAAGLYDISWQLERGHRPEILHSISAIRRNTVNEWGFGILLLVIMIFWMRVASLIHALYPPYASDNLADFAPFLLLGTLVGGLFTAVVFCISVFTQPVLMERRVDLMTAILTSVNAVWMNKGPMLLWALIILLFVALGFVSYFFGMIILMPWLGYATWHGYINSIETRRPRSYQ